MKRLLFLLCAATGTCAWAQVLTLPSNEWRHGDRLTKVQVEYVCPGDGCSGQVWRLGQVTKKSEERRESVASNG
ncbi:MAG: hypothetical protein J6Y99_05960, partial [Bacteroidales bacterium]|nr:hypothetical protein [Bacteroidales bacterium]